MKTSALILSCLLTAGSALPQTQPSRIPPWMLVKPKVATPSETNTPTSDLEKILFQTENMLERGFNLRKGTPSAPESMSIGPAVDAGVGVSAIDYPETEVTGPASNLAENLGVVTGQNLGMSLGQNCAVPTSRPRSGAEFSMTSIGSPVPEQQTEASIGIVSTHPVTNPYRELASIRSVIQTLLTVQQVLDRTLPTVIKLNAAVPKESQPLWAITGP